MRMSGFVSSPGVCKNGPFVSRSRSVIYGTRGRDDEWYAAVISRLEKGVQERKNKVRIVWRISENCAMYVHTRVILTTPPRLISCRLVTY